MPQFTDSIRPDPRFDHKGDLRLLAIDLVDRRICWGESTHSLRNGMETLDAGGNHGHKKWATFQKTLKRRPDPRPF